MDDYKELVSVLRCEADGFLMADTPDVLMADSLNSAADAIEELTTECRRLREATNTSKWISVEDENGQV